MQTHHRVFSLIGIILILATATAFVGAVLVYQRYIAPNQATPSTSSPKADGFEAQTAGWKTYTNNTLGFAIEYPPDFTVVDKDFMLPHVNGDTDPWSRIRFDTPFVSARGEALILVGINSHNTDCSVRDFFPELTTAASTNVRNREGITLEEVEWSESDTGINYYTTIYATLKHSPCYVLSLSIQTYEPEEGRPAADSFDNTKVRAMFEQMVSSFRFLK